MLRRPWSCVATPVILVAAVLALAGCGAAGEANPEKIGPQGVDELVVPTPRPDPKDFVHGVDNPWFPLAPGTVWTYDVSGGPATRLEVRVEPDRELVAGVSCVVVHRTETDSSGTTVAEGDTYYAQDTRGNVWTFGEAGAARTWRAGQHGAMAGLTMPATPRVGDGFLQERAPGIAADRSSVVSTAGESTVPAGTFDGLVLLQDTATEGDPLSVQRAYAEGTGLVEADTTVGGTSHAVLVSVTTP